ncbi:hypothetical protein P5F75_14610 [Caldifermentibacillus hisashii]|uniref:hypothetical protein n=1 Tax=Caldifermentibacillus hisashii TaxID=996558 RepID=UPI002E2295D4|nr:hypothetical protein [Caldifermentibacillus hisashii]
MTTRKGLVAKKWGFSAQNDDEIRSRRQKIKFSAQKWRREKGSSPKTRLSDLKTTTRTSLAAKNTTFSPQNGDENAARRQKIKFSGQK